MKLSFIVISSITTYCPGITLLGFRMKNPKLKLEEAFFSKFKSVQYFKRNQLIFGPTNTPAGVYFIKTGLVRMYLVSKDGSETTFNILKPGTYFSIIWAFNDVPNIYFYEALTDITLLKAPREEIVKFVEKNPAVLLDITKRTLSGLDGITRLMNALLTGNTYQRIASVLLVLARRFGTFRGKKVVINIPLTHRVISTLAGLTRESTSKELEALQANKIISIKNHTISILNLKMLEESSPISFVEQYKEEKII